jgi:hypothetical protein
MPENTHPTSQQTENHQVRQLLSELTLRVARIEQRLHIDSAPVATTQVAPDAGEVGPRLPATPAPIPAPAPPIVAPPIAAPSSTPTPASTIVPQTPKVEPATVA